LVRIAGIWTEICRGKEHGQTQDTEEKERKIRIKQKEGTEIREKK
jgi:hypothetical protein